MAGYTYSNLTTDIRNYTEVDSNVFTQAIINRFIENAEYRISYDVPIDADRKQSASQFATDNNSITVPLVNNAGSTATAGGFQCTIGPVNDRG